MVFVAAVASIFTALADVPNGLNVALLSSPPPPIIRFSPKLSSRFALSSVWAQQAPLLGSNSTKMDAFLYSIAATEKNVLDFTVKDIDGKDVSLSKFKGKVLLIVNVASKCGLTRTNYTELSQIYDKYKDQGFEILAFPCNQFGRQEPGSNPEIKEFACSRFKAKFPIFDKVNVNGPNTAPIYQFLKSNTGGNPIEWNFEKFLVDKSGKIIKRYPPITSPFRIEEDIQKLLGA